MEAVVGLMLMLLGVSHAVETHCDGRKDGAQCYAALGGTLVLQLVDRASDIFKFQLKLNTRTILDVREDKTLSNLISNRSIFTPSDGTFRISDLSRSDGGEYTLNMFNSQGQQLKSQTLQLFIQAPVSSLRLVNDCLSQGELKVSCLSEGGDSPEYSWTLDGRTLTDDKLLSGNKKNNTIILKQDVSGLLACSVKNNVSHVSAEKQMSTCGFIHIECDINGRHISQWVYEASNTLCIESTPTTGPETTVDKETNNFTSINQPSSSSTVETHCDGRKDGAQCYGALGGTLVLQLVDRASNIFRFQLKLNASSILTVRGNDISSNLISNRSIFTPSDGTFRINNLSRSDGGEYTMDMFNSQGRQLKPRTLQLFIQAPVSSLRLVNDCLSQGELKVSCLSEGGDSPEYSWTLDGRTLTDDKLLSGNNQNNTIILQQDVSGLLACSVKNNVSHVSAEKQMSTCGFIHIECNINGRHISQWVYEANNTLCIESTTTTGPDCSLLTCGLMFAMATLSVGGIFLFFHLKMRKSKKTKVPAATTRAMEYSENSFSVIELRG